MTNILETSLCRHIDRRRMPECTRDHGRPAPEGPRTKKASEEEVDDIVQRLYTTHTQSWDCSAGTPAAAEDLIRLV